MAHQTVIPHAKMVVETNPGRTSWPGLTGLSRNFPRNNPTRTTLGHRTRLRPSARPGWPVPAASWPPARPRPPAGTHQRVAGKTCRMPGLSTPPGRSSCAGPTACRFQTGGGADPARCPLHGQRGPISEAGSDPPDRHYFGIVNTGKIWIMLAAGCLSSRSTGKMEAWSSL